jgi:hypothetical protein
VEEMSQSTSFKFLFDARSYLCAAHYLFSAATTNTSNNAKHQDREVISLLKVRVRTSKSDVCCLQITSITSRRLGSFDAKELNAAAWQRLFALCRVVGKKVVKIRSVVSLFDATYLL